MGSQSNEVIGDSENIIKKNDSPKEIISRKSSSTKLSENEIVPKKSSTKDLEIEDLTSLTLKNEKCQKESCQCKMATKRNSQSTSAVFGPSKMAKHEQASTSQSTFDFKEITPPPIPTSPISPKLIFKESKSNKKTFNLKELTLDFKSLATNEQQQPSFTNDLFLFTATNSKYIHLNKPKKDQKHINHSKIKNYKPTHVFAIASESDDSDEELSEGLKNFNFSAKLPSSFTTPIPSTSSTTLTSNCSREALVEADGGGLVGGEDDWSMVELESYFENLCHIPKKMSAMAMMMYT